MRAVHSLLFLFLILWSAPAAGQDGLISILQQATEDHPDLQAAQAQREASQSEASKVSGLPDPVFAWSWFLVPVQTATGPQNHRLSLSQIFPWPGTLSARADAAEERARASDARWEFTRVHILESVALAWYDYAWLAAATLSTEEARDLLRQQEAILQDRYRTGTATHAELLRAQVELGRLEERVLALRGQRPSAAAHLNAARGLPVDTSVAWPVALEEPPRAIPDPSAVRVAASESNPLLDIHRHDAQAAGLRASAAQRSARPQFRVGVTTILTGTSELTSFAGQGEDAWSLDLAMSLPLWSGDSKAEEQQALAERRAQEAEVRASALWLGAEAEEALFALEEAQRRISLYRDALLPKAEEALLTTAVAYQTERASFTDFLETERTLLELQLELVGARRDEGKAAARIFALMGESFLADTNQEME